jgi:CubicO group peptidase (beta-lactamase class C family)
MVWTAGRRTDWETALPEEAGMDAEGLKELDQYVPKELPKLRSLLLIRKGRLVLENYYGGANADTLMDVRSVTKSFTGTAVGIALEEGLLHKDSPLSACLPEATLRRETGNTSIHDLLAMTSGLYWKTGPKLGEAYIYRLHRSKDWFRFIARLPVEPDSKGSFRYCSPGSHLLSCIVSYATGSCMEGYLRSRLFEPLGIKEYEWATDPQGHTAGHVFLKMKSRDMAKLGQLYLGRGQFGGIEIFSPQWALSAAGKQSEGLPGFGAYGYHWWITCLGGQIAHYAWGHGGTLIMIIPELELVAVCASDPQVNRWRDPRPMIENLIIPTCH